MGVKDRPQCYFDVEINREPGKMLLFGCSEIVLCEGQIAKSTSFDREMLKMFAFYLYLFDIYFKINYVNYL